MSTVAKKWTLSPAQRRALEDRMPYVLKAMLGHSSECALLQERGCDCEQSRATNCTAGENL